jgi:prepilin-type N-terminal cleavage/methylation domain-containing protein
MRVQAVRSQAGFSLLEVLVVVAIGIALAAMAGLQIIEARPRLQGDGGMRVVMSHMRTARELAISERRYMRLVYTAPSHIEILREEVPGPATTQVFTKDMESGVQFHIFAGLPDTPDAFGGGTPVNFGAALDIKFTPDGTLVNQNGGGANGTVFLGIPGYPFSARAVTVLGSTGRIRGYRWDGRIWKLV